MVACFGHAPSGAPRTSPEALIERFGAEEGAELRGYVEAVRAVAFAQHAGADLGESTRAMMAAVGAAFPELSEEALRAVGAYWSYSWR